MNRDRWYPTVVTLGDEPGRVFIASGFPTQMEIYSESSGTFSLVTTTGGDRAFSQLYPGLHLLPGGEIFYAPVGFGSAAGEQSGYFDFDPMNNLAGHWTDLGQGNVSTLAESHVSVCASHGSGRGRLKQEQDVSDY